MHVTSGDRDRTVPRDTREGPNVATGCSQASEESVPQAVQDERAHLRQLQSVRVLSPFFLNFSVVKRRKCVPLTQHNFLGLPKGITGEPRDFDRYGDIDS